MEQQYEPVKGLSPELTEEQKKQVAEYKDYKETKQALAKVIRGHNDVFKKHYDLKELDLEFDIAIRFPNALEQAKIQAQAERYLDGLGSLMSPVVLQSYNMLATLRVCGVDIPDFLKRDEEIYNLHILYVISEDFYEWMNSFRY